MGDGVQHHILLLAEAHRFSVLCLDLHTTILHAHAQHLSQHTKHVAMDQTLDAWWWHTPDQTPQLLFRFLPHEVHLHQTMIRHFDEWVSWLTQFRVQLFWFGLFDPHVPHAVPGGCVAGMTLFPRVLSHHLHINVTIFFVGIISQMVVATACGGCDFHLTHIRIVVHEPFIKLSNQLTQHDHGVLNCGRFDLGVLGGSCGPTTFCQCEQLVISHGVSCACSIYLDPPPNSLDHIMHSVLNWMHIQIQILW